jgi:hypothetical protein
VKFKQAFSLIAFLITSYSLLGQELNCRVQVLSGQVQLSDKRVFTSLETTIREFINNQRWTNDQFKRDERIECNFTFNITKFNLPDDFEGTLQIQSRRPVFGSNYGSVMMNHMDQDIRFRYLEGTPLEFADNAFISNLASLIGFYAYVVLAMDYDSYALEGGTQFWQKAQQVVQNAQQEAAKGWKATDIPPRNRFWLVENYVNPIFLPLRQANYKFHRLGLDQMHKDVDGGRANIMESLKDVREVHKARPSSFNVQVFFNAKADEIVNIYQQANPPEKADIMPILNEIDPTGATKYKKITQ